MQKRIWSLSLIFLLSGFSLFPISFIEIKDRKENKILFHRKVSQGEIIHFSYIHSVELFTVNGFLMVEGCSIKIIETQFPSFGAGLPNILATNKKEGGKSFLSAKTDSVKLEKFSLFVSHSTHPTLYFRNNQIGFELERWVKDGEIVDIQIRQTPLIYFLVKRIG